MKFAELYKENKRAVKELLTSMWCSEPRSERQLKYAGAIKKLIDTELFASESHMPLVQCMDMYQSSTDAEATEVFKLIDKKLWLKCIAPNKFNPYKHQVEAWKSLTNKTGPKKSMVVTTGTGSGKTECFMLPLVNDLLEHNRDNEKHEIQAIFLYPLNALMEDQKGRLQKLLADTKLKFAVYNGNMPNNAGNLDSKRESERNEAKRVNEERNTYNRIIATRDEMHATPPNILLTNPTMLEYMLLRQKDQVLFTKKSLRWIVIDETHTFSGAGAAELSMLIRRVLDAFSLEPSDIRFATSSATIGNAETENEIEKNNEKLRDFISKITGVSLEQVDLITGERDSKVTDATNPEVARCRKILHRNDYVQLNELFPNENESIETKLNKLDALCSLATSPLKAKVHFFYRVPNNGLRVRLDDFNNGVFKIHSTIPLSNTSSPYLELMRCEHCGEYFAVGESVPGSSHKFRALTASAEDIFVDDKDSPASKLVFGLTNKEIDEEARDGDNLVTIKGDEYHKEENTFINGWSIVQNVKYCCPHCHKRVLGSDKESSKKADTELQIEESENNSINKNARAFRVYAPLISRTLAPSILSQLKPIQEESESPHNGQQYISFVDSRKTAAESTLRQNIQEERIWVYSRVLNALNKKRKAAINSFDANKCQELKRKYDILSKMPGFEQEALNIKAQLDKMTSQDFGADISMTWDEVFNLLINQPECEWLAYQFVNKGEHDSDINSDEDKVENYAKVKYVLSVMVEQLAHRPRQAASPETMGLLSVTYPKLNRITHIPQAVEEFKNKFLSENEKGKFDLKQWKNLLKIFLDNVTRSNQSIYLQRSKSPEDTIDIFSCQRYGTKKPSRRPTKEPHISDDPKSKGTISAVAGLIGNLIPNPNNKPLSDIVFEYREDINKVLRALWIDLTTSELLQISQRYDQNWIPDDAIEEDGIRTEPYRLNVVDISFKAVEEACLVDSRSPGKTYPALRPVDTLFMGFSPYLIGNKVVKPATEMQVWDPYPYDDGLIDGRKVSREEILSWANTARPLLCDNSIWGEDGCFSSRLNDIYSYPDIFIQAEHTAQVNKLLSKHSQELFKKQKLNILACSTTMEMGVDLGNLELVLMTSIPPHPSNYKQRAGRSGRNDDTRSACITLCGSDAVGLRTLDYPMEQLINRKMQVPNVDLQSPQVIQRHANAYLFRESHIFFDEASSARNNLGQEVISFFTPYYFSVNEKNGRFTIRKNDAEATEIYPDNGLGDENETKYYRFLNYLNNGDRINDSLILDAVKDSLNIILRDTCFENGADACIERCKSDMRRLYESLELKVNDIADAYCLEKDRLLGSGKKSDRDKVEGGAVNSGYGYLLRHKFSELLSQNMLTFLATNRFTPNANMPVEIIEFHVNLKRDSREEFKYSLRKPNNPSYPLHEAISQYVPGNTIVLENKTSIIRGIAYTGQYKQTATFKKIYSDGENTVIDFPNRLEKEPKEWSISRSKELELIEPVSFIPDVNEDYSRVIDKNAYTQVSAQLIGASAWQNGESHNSMIAMRSNRDCCEAKILYYNEGIGYGYCFCPDCGKTILETKPRIGKFDIPEDMNDQQPKDGGRPFHYHIDRRNKGNKGKGKRIPCYPKKIFRNVILGGLIQTDYCEVKIKDLYGHWIERSKENDSFLITLGILLTKAFTEYINKDRNDVSFALMPNGHLCIFDTNPGGSGYSNELSGQRTMHAVIDKSIEILNELKSKDALLDKFTQKYLDRLDIDTVKEWVFKVKESMETIPEDVKKVFGNAKIAVVEDIFRDFRKHNMYNSDKIIFVNSDWNKWLYDSDAETTQTLTNGFKQRSQDIRSKADNVIVAVLDTEKIPVPIERMIMKIEDWGKVHVARNTMPKGFFPLAIVAGNLYFTTNKDYTNANYDWAKNDVYYIPVNEATRFNYKKYDVTIGDNRPNIKKFKLDLSAHTRIYSSELGAIVESKVKPIVDKFVDYCSIKPSSCVKVTYQDEHLKSAAAMVTTFQFIEHYISKISNHFSVSFITEEYDESSRGNTIFNNITNDYERDDILRSISEAWKDAVNNNGMECGEIQIDTMPARSLPHWRSLTFECDGKSLCFYPNGGIINEWFEDRARTYGRCYSNESITTEEDIPLRRYKEVMYDVEIIDD